MTCISILIFGRHACYHYSPAILYTIIHADFRDPPFSKFAHYTTPDLANILMRQMQVNDEEDGDIYVRHLAILVRHQHRMQNQTTRQLSFYFTGLNKLPDIKST